MHRIRQFAELFDARATPVELHQGGVDGRQIQSCVRAAEAPETRVSRRRRVDRQQMEYATTERVEDVGQFRHEVAQFARRWNDGVTLLVQRLQLRLQLLVCRCERRLRPAKKPGERAINRVGGAIGVGMDRYARVRSLGPDLPARFIERVSLGLEIADFGQGQFNDPFVAFAAHRDVAPGRARQWLFTASRSDDLVAQDRSAAQSGPQPAAPVFRNPFAVRAAKRETNAVPDETQQAFAGGG